VTSAAVTAPRARRAALLAGALALASSAAVAAWLLFSSSSPALATAIAVTGGARAGALPIGAGAKLGAGERLALDAGARVRLTLPDGERLDLDGPALLELLSLDPARPSELWLRRGRLGGVAPSAQRRASPIVYTRHATLTARAARFEVTTDESATRLRVGRGRLLVDAPGGTSLALSAGQRLELRTGTPPAAAADPAPLPAD
jgi:ferric-dicitrate binding protein FerR (iron transport regulator)